MRLISLICMLFITRSSFSQELSPSTFNELLSKKRVLYFDTKNQKYYGCGMNLDCEDLPIVFKNIIFNKDSRRLTIEGYVYPTIDNGDTIGTNFFKIFVAKPIKSKLKNVRVLASVNNDSISLSRGTIVNARSGNFKIDFPIINGDRLYIESTGFFELKEYNISLLLKRKN